MAEDDKTAKVTKADKAGKPAKADKAAASVKTGKAAKAEQKAQDKAIAKAAKGKAVDQEVARSLRPTVLSVRFVLALLLLAAGIAWIAYYYVTMSDGFGGVEADAGGPAFMRDLVRWNYVIGFGAIFLGLVVAAHPKTPLGRGRGVVVGMLGCFLIGLLWICVFYVFANNNAQDIWVLNDLSQWNLVVGIGFMAVGFAYATRWE